MPTMIGVSKPFLRILVRSDQIFQQFSTRFIGKISPVHFFWGSFDLAVTRFSDARSPREGAIHNREPTRMR